MTMKGINSMDVDSSVTSNFHLFSQLPPELRLKIWRFALPDPRIVEILLKSPEHDDIEYMGTKSSQYGLRWCWCTDHAEVAPPELMLVNTEARNLALKFYSPLGTWDAQSKPWRRVYVDFSIDTIYLSDFVFRALMFNTNGKRHRGFFQQPFDVNQVRSLALHSWARMRHSIEATTRHELIPMFRFTAKMFENLQDLFLIIDGRIPLLSSPDRLVDPTDEFPEFDSEPGSRASTAQGQNSDRTAELGAKERVLKLVEDAVQDAQAPDPELSSLAFLSVSFKLLINGPIDPPVLRKWFYGRGLCKIEELSIPLKVLGKDAYEYSWT